MSQATADQAPDADLGLDAPPPSPDARNEIALRRFYAPVGVAVVVVAAVLFFATGLPPVPSYTAQVEIDGKTAAPLVAAPTSTLDVRLAPAGDPGGPVWATVYVAEGDKVRQAMDAHPEVDDTGAVRLTGAVGPTLGVTGGKVQVVLLVARPGAEPETPKDVLGDGPWHAARFTLEVTGSGG